MALFSPWIPSHTPKSRGGIFYPPSFFIWCLLWWFCRKWVLIVHLLYFVHSGFYFRSGWLVGLLVPLADDRRRVVTPVIDRINKTSFQFEVASSNVVGTFDFLLHFGWKEAGAHDVISDEKLPQEARRLRYVGLISCCACVTCMIAMSPYTGNIALHPQSQHCVFLYNTNICLWRFIFTLSVMKMTVNYVVQVSILKYT